jgi:hypothetical protein
MNDIGEEDRDLLVLRVDIAVVDWCATAVAKPGVR